MKKAPDWVLKSSHIGMIYINVSGSGKVPTVSAISRYNVVT